MTTFNKINAGDEPEGTLDALKNENDENDCTEDSESKANAFFEVGVVLGAYGVHGWTKIRPYAPLQHKKNVLFNAKCWRLIKEDKLQTIEVLNAKPHGAQTIVAQFAGYNNRDDAQDLKGAQVWVNRIDFPALESEEYYWVDLIGLNVFNSTGVLLGQVVGLIDNGAHSVLRIADPVDPTQHSSRSPCKNEQLIPFVNAHVREVDLHHRQMIVDWEI